MLVTQKFSAKFSNLFLGVLCFSAISTTAFVAKANDVSQSIQEINAVVDALKALVTGFTTVMITPMGISAAAKAFRHVVLANM